MLSVDHHLYLDINKLTRHTHWAHGFMSAYALWLGLVVIALLTVAAGFWARRRGSLEDMVTVVLTGVGTLIALGINHYLSKGIARVRPCHAYHHVVHIVSCANDYGFPSDHATIAGALAAGLLVLNRRWGAVAVVVAITVAFARVYAGVHYPADVIAGLLFGAAVTLALLFALRSRATALARRLESTPLGPLIFASPRPRVR